MAFCMNMTEFFLIISGLSIACNSKQKRDSKCEIKSVMIIINWRKKKSQTKTSFSNVKRAIDVQYILNVLGDQKFLHAKKSIWNSLYFWWNEWKRTKTIDSCTIFFSDNRLVIYLLYFFIIWSYRGGDNRI